MIPEDVKPRDMVREVNDIAHGLAQRINAYMIPAHEVGAIIKAAVEAGKNFGTLDAYEYKQESIDRIYTEYRRWLAKAEELEKMK